MQPQATTNSMHCEIITEKITDAQNVWWLFYNVFKKVCKINIFLTLSGPAFSVVRQARGGSEARMSKIKLTSTD